jgi:serine/threonine protein kinase
VATLRAEDTSRTQAGQGTVAASLSSFQGLLGAGDSGSGQASRASADSDIAASGSVRFESAQATGVGQTFGRYQIKKVLGSGSMGSVFLAHDSQLNRDVALKIPRMERDVSGEMSQRLHREARAAATLSHPNICPIYDVIEQSGTCFIAMGYVAGKPLSAYLGKKVQSEREVAKVVRKLALALEEAHAQGIVHRDLKPSNIMIDKRGEPIVMDFGVACFFDAQTQTRLTQQGSLVGTPSYMSPEQIEGKTKVGPASDIYSLGVVLYELLTGRCPFRGTVVNVISQVLHQSPPDPREFRRDLSPGIVEIVNRAMRKVPAERFASMHDFAKALTAFLNGPARGSEEPEPRESTEEEEIARSNQMLDRIKHQPLPTVLPPRRRVASKKKRTRWIPVGYGAVIATALVVMGVLIGAWLVDGRKTPQVAVADQSPARDSGLAPSSPEANDAPTSEHPMTDAAQPTSSGTKTQEGSLSTPASSVARKSNEAMPGSSSGAPLNQTIAAGSSAAASNKPHSTPSSGVGDVPSRAGTATTAPSSSATVRPPALPANGSADATGSTHSEPAQGASATRPSKENPDLADPDRPRRRRGPEEPDEGPPPFGRAGGPVPFDGGRKKGMSIEQYFKKLDTDHDGKLDPSELPLHIINRADTSKDGELTLSELKKAFKKLGQKLFAPPTPAEMRRLPGGGPPPMRPPPMGPPPPRKPGGSDGPRPESQRSGGL